MTNEDIIRSMFKAKKLKNEDLENWEPYDTNDEEETEEWLKREVPFSEFKMGKVRVETPSGAIITYADYEFVLDELLPWISTTNYDYIEGHEMGSVPVDESEWR